MRRSGLGKHRLNLSQLEVDRVKYPTGEAVKLLVGVRTQDFTNINQSPTVISPYTLMILLPSRINKSPPCLVPLTGDRSHTHIAPISSILAELLCQPHRLPAVIHVDIVAWRSLVTVHRRARRLATAINPHWVTLEASLGHAEAHFSPTLELVIYSTASRISLEPSW